MDLDYIQEVSETEMVKLDEKQRKYLKDRYNFYGRFEVGINEDLNCIVFETTADTYKSMEYYLGFEYEREDRQIFVNVYNDVLVVYEFENKRIQELLYTLGILEEETEEEEV